MATSSNSSNINAGGSTQTGTGGVGSITSGGALGIDFSGPNPNVPTGGSVDTGDAGGSYSAGYSQPVYDAQAAAAAAAAAERERIAAENVAKRQANDRKIAADAQKAQREHRNMPANLSTQAHDALQAITQPQSRQQAIAQAHEAASMGGAKQQQGEAKQPDQQEQNQNKQTSVRHAPGGQLYDGETGEILDSNNMTLFNGGPTESMRLAVAKFHEGQNKGNRGAVIGRAGQRTPGKPVAPNIPNGTQVPNYKTPATPQMPQQPTKGKTVTQRSVFQQPQQVSVVEQPTTRQRADAIFYREARKAEKDAQANNERIENNYNQWVEQHPMANGSVPFPVQLLQEEAFGNEAEPLMKSNYRTLDEYEEGREATGAGTEQKDTRRQDRMIDNLARDMKLGFFHITTERIAKDKTTGRETVRWSAPVEDAMSNVMEYFGLHGIEGQRNVFRLVRMYASMGVDSNGNMFNEGKDEWSLNEREFVTICNFVLRSCIEHGHPMAMPFKRWQLRGTDIYPSGVMPKVLAQAITGPESNLRMSPADLVQMCQDEWNGRTYPTMKANLYRDNSEDGGKNEIAQRVAIERMQQAISRLDGISAEDFSRRYGVDTSLHYKLSEYEDQLAEYVTAANGNYDSDKVAEKKRERIEYYKRQAMRQKGVKFHIEETDQLTEEVVIDGVKHRSYIQAGANLITSLARINSILSRPVLAIASLNEKAVGNLRTKFGIDILTAIENDGQKKYTVSDQAYERIKSEEAVKALDAAKMLFEIGGPGAARLFAQEGKPCTHENVTSFLQDRYLQDSSQSDGLARQIDEKRKKLQNWSQKLMVGDLVFKKSDTINWFNALLLSNASLGHAQDKLAANGVVDQSGGISLTGNEIEDIMAAHTDIAGFFTEMLGTDAGISAYNMMRANSIAQVNPVSYYTDRFLRDHGVTNMMITMFVDTFPIYGLNYLYNLMPFSRTLTYLGVKKTEGRGTDNAIGNVDLTIGGNLSDSGIDFNDPGFQAGLRMNLVFDAMTLGHNLLVGGMLGLVFLALGFEPPDDDENLFNISMWKIGGKEIQWAWWLNDLTLLGMPFAYYIAAGHKTGDWQLAGQLMMDSLHDQVDGNVVLDFADIVANWRYDIMEFEQMSKDPSYTGPANFTSFALAELYSNLLRAGNKITPGAPLFDSISRSALIRGIDARTADPRKVFKHSSDEELDKWYKEHGVTESVDSYFEMLDRKYSTGNWLYALANNARYGVFGDNQKTGFFWWEMPVRTMGDPLAYVWAGEFTMDYDNMPEGMSREQYDAEMANKVLNYVNQFSESGLNASEAVKNYGFIIPGPARKATLEYLYDELRQLDNEWIARNASGELADKNDYQVAKGIYYARRDNINTLIYDWLKNDDIPEWGSEYEQLLTDYDVTYVYKDSGKPVPMGAWIDQFDPNVEAIYKPKGNHPTSLLPWTEVDYSDNITNRGYNAETTPYWWHEGMSGSDAEALRNLTLSDGTKLEDAVIPYGRDTGEKLGDVLFGMQNRGVYSNPDEPTIGWRAYVPKKTELSDDIRSIGKDYENEWNNNKGNISNAAWSGSTMYPRRSYGRGYGSSGYSSSSNYNPKIYTFKAQNTRINDTHVTSTKTNPYPRSVTADKAASMYSKQPQSTKVGSYLRPGFSTKGSREAYKRQDI
jgi:hypothetical protein